MHNELSNLIYSPMLKANDVMRYSCVHLHQPESLDHHIFDISMISYMMAKKFKSYGEDIDVGKVLELALVHDLEETITGDVPRNTKYCTKYCKESMDDVGEIVIKRLARENDGFDDLVDLWRNAKTGREGMIIKLADMLCVVRKSMIEVELYGNREMLRVTIEVVAHISKTLELFKSTKIYNASVTKYVIDLLEQSLDMLNATNNKYSDTIKAFGIDKSVLI